MRMPETSTEQTQVDFRNARLPTALMLQILLTANFGTSPLLSSYLALIHAHLFTRRSLWPQSKAAFQINIAARIH
jgi:hypothetical protein